MKNTDLVQLLRELADYIARRTEYNWQGMATNSTPEIEQLEVRARQAADEIEGREVTPKRLKEFANAIGGAECSGTDHDCLGIALATYFESSRHRPDIDPPSDEDGLDGWSQWVMARTNEMLIDAAKIAIIRFGGGEGQP